MAARRLVALALAALVAGAACGPGTPTVQLSIVSGDKQSTLVDTALPQKLVVLVKTSKGVLAGHWVAFEVPGGLGTVSPPALLTDAHGHASTALSVGPNPGTVTVVANAGPGVTVAFTETAKLRPAQSFEVGGFPSSVEVGERSSFDVAALDASGNVATSYSGTVHFTSTDPKAALPSDTTLTNGVGRFFATLDTVGAQVITATDTQDSTFAGSQDVTVNCGPAAGLVVRGYPSPAAAGASESFTVTAVDVGGNRSDTYAGKVHFTSTDSKAALPADSTLTEGQGTFQAAMGTVGTQSITATDSDQASVTGSQTGIDVIPGGPAKLAFAAQPTATPMNATMAPAVEVAVEDVEGNPVTDANTAITLALGTGPAAATLSGTLTEQANGGTASFADLSLDEMGTYTLVASADGLTAATSDSFAIGAGPAAKLVVSGFPTTIDAGQSATLTVEATDLEGNFATTYQGTVHFTSSAWNATLPADAPLTNGTGTFSATLNTAGTQSITATDTTDENITGTEEGITVKGGAAAGLVVAGFPSPITVGSTGGFTVTAVDQYGNTDTAYADTVRITSSDPNATLPNDATLPKGIGTFSLKFATPGTQSITVTDTADPTLTGTQSGITVMQ